MRTIATDDDTVWVEEHPYDNGVVVISVCPDEGGETDQVEMTQAQWDNLVEVILRDN